MKRDDTPGKRERGATMIEASLAILVFFSLLFGCISLALTAFNRLALRHALSKTARYTALGQREVGSSREESIQRYFQAEVRRVGLGLQPTQFSVCPLANPLCSPDRAGAPNEMVALTASFRTDVPVLRQVWVVEERVVTRNENFDP